MDNIPNMTKEECQQLINLLFKCNQYQLEQLTTYIIPKRIGTMNVIVPDSPVFDALDIIEGKC